MPRSRAGPSRAAGALLLLAYLAFVSLGLPDAVLGVAWPSVRETFAVPQALLGLPLAVSAVAYFASGLLAGRLIQSIGIGVLLAGSTALVSAGVFGFALSPAFVVFVLVAPIVGFGSGAIDAALNTYAARNFSPKHMNWLHAAYSAGAMAGPVIMTFVLARGLSWRVGYATVAFLLAGLVVAFVATARRWRAGAGSQETAEIVKDAPGGVGPLMQGPRVTGWTALRSGRVRLQLAIFFLYTGIEITAGQWSYTILREARGMDTASAGAWVATYWGGILAGRLLLGFVVERLGAVRMLRVAFAGVVVCSAVFALPGQTWTVAALPLLALSLSSIYPGLMAETPRRVGEALAPHAVGFQVSAATAGVAVLPSLSGLLGERLGLEAIGFVILGAAAVLGVLHERLVATADRAHA